MLRSLFILTIVGSGMLAGLYSRFAALLLYLWYALFRPLEWVWFDISALRLSLLIGMVLVIPSVMTGVFPNVTHGVSLLALAFVGSALVSQWGAFNPEVGWLWLDSFARLVTVALLLVRLVTTPYRLYLVLLTVAVSFGVHSSKAGLVSVLRGGAQFTNGLGGAFADNNGYAVGMVMIIPLLLAAAQNAPVFVPGARGRWLGRALYTGAFFSAFAVVSTYSRGGFLGLMTIAVTYTVLQRRRLLALVGMGVLTLVALAVAPITDQYRERLTTIQTYEEVQEGSALGRLHFWAVARRMAADRVFGVGIRNYEVAYDRYDDSGGAFGTGRAVHSSHFQVLAELGVPGFTIYVLLFLYAFLTAWRIRRRAFTDGLSPGASRFLFTAAVAIMTSMAGFLVSGAFVALALNDLSWITFGMLAALDRLSLKIVELPSTSLTDITLEVDTTAMTSAQVPSWSSARDAQSQL